MRSAGSSTSKWLYELRRRHVFRVVGGYVVGFWVVLQVADVVLPALGAPDWSLALLIIVGIAGIPLAAVASYVWDITPDGIRRTDEHPGDDIAEPSLGPRWIDYLIIAALLIVLAFVLMNRSEPDFVPLVGNSVAILPFDDLSEDRSSRHLADGIAEAVMNRLTRAPDIVVAARTSSFALRNDGLDAPSIAERLGVDALLEGSIQRVDDRIRINARLVDGRQGTQVWSQRYDASVDEVFVVQDEIARAIAEVMQVQLASIGGSTLETDNLEAYDLYLRARSDLRAASSSTAVERAIERFEQAVRLDASFAPAAAGLCRALWERYELRRDPALVEPAITQCSATRERFPDSVETRIALGELRLGTGEPEQSESSFRNALAQEPHNAEAHSGLSRALRAQGRLEEATSSIRRAIDLDPAFWRYRRELGIVLSESGNFEDAIESLQSAIRLEPNSAESLYSLGVAYAFTGEFLKAGDAFERSIRIEPNAPAYTNAGTALYFAREFSRAEAMFQRAVELVPDDFLQTGFLAWSIREQGGRLQDAEYWHRATIETATSQLEVNPNDWLALAARALHFAALDDIPAAEVDLASLPPPDEMHPNALILSAFAHLNLGHREQSARIFRQAVELGYPLFLLEIEPRLDTAWNDAVFSAILRPDDSTTPLEESSI